MPVEQAMPTVLFPTMYVAQNYLDLNTKLTEAMTYAVDSLSQVPLGDELLPYNLMDNQPNKKQSQNLVHFGLSNYLSGGENHLGRKRSTSTPINRFENSESLSANGMPSSSPEREKSTVKDYESPTKIPYRPHSCPDSSVTEEDVSMLSNNPTDLSINSAQNPMGDIPKVGSPSESELNCSLDSLRRKNREDIKIQPYALRGSIEIFRCPLCEEDEIFNREQLTHHLQGHQSSFRREDYKHVCCFCFSELSSNSSLERHLLTHTNHRPFNCSFCDKAFTTNGNLSRHIRTSHQLRTDGLAHSDSNDMHCSSWINGNTMLQSAKHLNFSPPPKDLTQIQTADPVKSNSPCSAQIEQKQPTPFSNLYFPRTSFFPSISLHLPAKPGNDQNLAPQVTWQAPGTPVWCSPDLDISHGAKPLSSFNNITNDLMASFGMHSSKIMQWFLPRNIPRTEVFKSTTPVSNSEAMQPSDDSKLCSSTTGNAQPNERSMNASQPRDGCVYKYCESDPLTDELNQTDCVKEVSDWGTIHTKPKSTWVDRMQVAHSTKHPVANRILSLTKRNPLRKRVIGNLKGSDDPQADKRHPERYKPEKVTSLSSCGEDSEEFAVLDLSLPGRGHSTQGEGVSSSTNMEEQKVFAESQLSGSRHEHSAVSSDCGLDLSSRKSVDSSSGNGAFSIIAIPSSEPSFTKALSLPSGFPNMTTHLPKAAESAPHLAFTDHRSKFPTLPAMNGIKLPFVHKKNSYKDAPKLITCPISGCNQKFPWNSSLKRHILTHTPHKPFACTRCNKSFSTKSNRERHMERVHQVSLKRQRQRMQIQQLDGSPACGGNLEGANYPQSMSSRSDQGGDELGELREDEILSMSSNEKQAEDISNSLLICAGDPVIEPNPGRLYTAALLAAAAASQTNSSSISKADLSSNRQISLQTSTEYLIEGTHKRKMSHRSSRRNDRQANETANLLKDIQGDLSGQTNSHESVLDLSTKNINNSAQPQVCIQCPICSTEVLARNFRRHISDHQLENPVFRCHVCLRTFRDRLETLKHWSSSHTGEWNRFILKHGLSGNAGPVEAFAVTPQEAPDNNTLHQADQQIETFTEFCSEKSENMVECRAYVSCCVCLHRFGSQQDLQRHMRSHTGERPFACPDCGKEFSLKHSMHRHYRVHLKHNIKQSSMSSSSSSSLCVTPEACSKINR